MPQVRRKSRFNFPNMPLTWHVKLGKALASFRPQLPIFGFVMLHFASAACPDANPDQLRGVGYMEGKHVNQKYYLFYKIFI